MTINAIGTNLPIEVAKGGTGAATLTQYGVLVGNATSAVSGLTAGTNGQLLVGGTSANPAFHTLTSSDSTLAFTTGSTTLSIQARAGTESVTGVVELATGAETTTGTSTALAVHPAGLDTRLGTQTSNGVVLGGGGAGNNLGVTAAGTNGQLLVGSTSNPPVFATVTDGEAITTTLGAGTFQIDCEDATDSNKGVAELSTDAETVTGTDTGRVTTPANITAKMAAPGTIGGTTPAGATFTVLTCSNNQDASTQSLVANTNAGNSARAYLSVAADSATGGLGAFSTTYTANTAFQDSIVVVANAAASNLVLAKGTSGNIKMVADSTTLFDMTFAGERIMPLQPAFEATMSGAASNETGDGTTYQVIFQTEAGDQNADYNNSTGLFTAPVAGYYLFTFCLSTSGYTADHDEISVDFVRSVGGNPRVALLYDATGQERENRHINGSMVLKMGASETVYVAFMVNGAGAAKVIDIDTGTFSGVLLC